MDNTKYTPDVVEAINKLSQSATHLSPQTRRLIAAAPEMLDCLKGLIDEIERCGVDH